MGRIHCKQSVVPHAVFVAENRFLAQKPGPARDSRRARLDLSLILAQKPDFGHKNSVGHDALLAVTVQTQTKMSLEVYDTSHMTSLFHVMLPMEVT